MQSDGKETTTLLLRKQKNVCKKVVAEPCLKNIRFNLHEFDDGNFFFGIYYAKPHS